MIQCSRWLLQQNAAPLDARAGPRLFDQPDQVGQVRDADLPHRLQTVGVYGLRGHLELPGDFAIGEARGGELDDLAFARCEERIASFRVVDLDSGKLVAFLYFEAGTTEIFDIQTLPGMRWPAIVGFQDETLDGIMIGPPGAWEPGATLPIGNG